MPDQEAAQDTPGVSTGSTGRVSTADDRAWRAAWEAALDDLELTVESTEALLRGEVPAESGTTPVLTAWLPPRLDGPMPGDLRTRALALLHRQQDLIGRVRHTSAGLRHQLQLVERVAGNRRTDEQPVYLDIRA
ncbi:MAG TPA: hypothetical protein VFM50_05390 [Nocardioidaceae bacterium]|nr:hypothetical protein [Nocardioidaceae bacterium]